MEKQSDVAVTKTENYVKSGPEPGFYKLGRKEVVGYSLVDFSMNLVFQAIMMFITFYYTDVFELRPTDVAMLFLVSRVWDTINDPLWGLFVERVNPKRGKYKPWILYGAIPFGIMAILTYTVPSGFSYMGKLAWAYLTYNGLNMLYTFIIQPYISVATVMTGDPSERTKLNSIRMMFAQSGGIIVALAIPTLSQYFGKADPARGYQMTVILLSVVMVFILMYAYTTIIEKIKAVPTNERAGIKDIFYQFTHNQPIVVLFFLFLGVYGFSTVTSASGVYYMTYNVSRPDLVGMFSLMNVLPSVLGVPFVPMLVRKIKKKNTVILGLVLAAIGSALLWFVPVTSIFMMMLMRGIGSFGYGILMGILWSIIPDAVEYAEYHTGKRYPAIVYTLVGLGLKASLTIGGVIPTLILEYVKYVPNQAQSAQALMGIRFMTSLLPSVVCIGTIVIFGLFYKLTEEKVTFYMHELAIRNGTLEN